MKIKHINHSSLLIESDGFYIWTDPWVISNAFDSWTPNPFPTYKSIKHISSIPKNKLTILISHGHDDHIDDFILSNHFSQCNFIIPKLKSPGLLNRIKKITDNIIEVGNKEFEHNYFLVSNYINSNLTHDDTIFVIRNKEKVLIHANDNWQQYDDNIYESINSISNNYKKKERIFCVQLGIADAYPHSYIMSDEDALRISKNRMQNYLNTILYNIDRLDVEGALIYANQAKSNFLINRELEIDLKNNMISDYPNLKQLLPDTEIPNFTECLPLKSNSKTIFEFFLEQYENSAIGFIKEKLPEFDLKFNLIGSELSEEKITYTTNTITWCNLFTGKSQFETLSVGGVSQIYVPNNVNISKLHHCLTSWGYKKRNEILKFGIL
jgi:hypothetical protein